MTRTAPTGGLLLAALAVATLLAASGDAGADETAPGTTAPRCKAECRGLGLEKVKAGDEHCGLVSREHKDAALDAACTLADSHREELQALAEERARDKCGSTADREGCRCRVEFRRWENVYTHVLSQRCWTECGWACFIECRREPEAGEDGG